MVLKLVTEFFNYFSLTPFNFRINKLNDFTGIDTHHMIVVMVCGYFEYRVATIKIVPLDDAGSFELREHSVDSRQADVFAVID